MKMVVALLNLTKFRLCAAVAFSAAAGFVIARREITSEIFAPALGTFLLACGCCGLNQFQERKIDARMERTSRRPLPARKMKPGTALSISLGLMALGLSVLFLKAHVLAGALGLFAALLYNGVYARLKPRTTLAVIPGAMVGAVPPTIGWVSGGEALLADRHRGPLRPLFSLAGPPLLASLPEVFRTIPEGGPSDAVQPVDPRSDQKNHIGLDVRDCGLLAPASPLSPGLFPFYPYRLAGCKPLAYWQRCPSCPASAQG